MYPTDLTELVVGLERGGAVVVLCLDECDGGVQEALGLVLVTRQDPLQHPTHRKLPQVTGQRSDTGQTEARGHRPDGVEGEAEVKRGGRGQVENWSDLSDQNRAKD